MACDIAPPAIQSPHEGSAAATIPSKDIVLEACRGAGSPTHPLLGAARELARLHRDIRGTTATRTIEILRTRAGLVHDIDCWASGCAQPHGAALLHTETLGMVVDRIARFSVAAHCGLEEGCSESQRHYLWLRLGELALAYDDLTVELASGRRRLPSLTASKLLAPFGPNSAQLSREGES